MPIDDHKKQVFDEAPTDTKLGMLYLLTEQIFNKLDEHPTNCNARFFAMEEDIKRLSKWKIAGLIASICSAVGVSAGLAVAYIKGWVIFIKG